MKKLPCFIIILFSFFRLCAQVPVYEYASGKLTAEKISEIVDKARNNGTEEWELSILQSNLQQQLKRQQNNHEPAARILPSIPQAACTNLDFETGNINGWTLTSGNIMGVNLPCDACANTADANITVVSSTSTISGTCSNGIDYCTGLPVVAPDGGSFSYLLNSATPAGTVKKIEQTFAVSSTNSILSYRYLAVLQDGGHPANQESYFSMQLTDQAGNTIPCSFFTAHSDTGIAGWNHSANCFGTSYRGWKTAIVDLSAYVGTNIKIRFVASGCNQGGHFGYAYVDASCTGEQIMPLNPTICNNIPATLIGPSGYTSYSWIGPGISGSANNQSCSVSTPGTYSVIVTGLTGCTFTLSTVVSSSVALPPNVAVSSGGTICPGAAATLTATGTNTYLWTGNSIYATTNSIVVHPFTTSTYTVLGSTGSCAATNTVTVTVTPSPTITATGTLSICKGQTTTITAGGASSYTWSSNAGGGSNATVVLSPTVTTNYTVTGSNGICSAPHIFAITVSPNPNMTVNSASICAGTYTTLTATGALAYTWTPASGLSSTTTSTVSAGPFTTTSYTIIGNNNGCFGYTMATVTVNPLPIASFSVATAMPVAVNTSVAFLDQSSGGSSYFWNFGDGAMSTLQSPSHSYATAGTYAVTETVTTAKGCKDTVSTVVQVEVSDAVIYNSFSPNGDGLNDVFVIDNIDKFSPNHISIYNRWGQLLWDADNYDNKNVVWDGKDNKGSALPPGTYYYIIEMNGKSDSKHWVELLR